MRRSDEYVKVCKRTKQAIYSQKRGIGSKSESQDRLHQEQGLTYNEIPIIMERGANARHPEPRLRHFHSKEEQEYHAVDDPEKAPSSIIRPSLPMSSSRDYADRCIPARDSFPSVSGSPDMPPRVPKRNIPGPAVYRDLKPGRQQTAQRYDKRVTQDAENPRILPRHPVSTPRDQKPLPREPQRPISLGQSPPVAMCWTPKTPPQQMQQPTHRSQAASGSPSGMLFKDSSCHESRRSKVPSQMQKFSQDLEFRDHMALSLNTQKKNYFEVAGAHRGNHGPHMRLQAQDDINVHKHTPKARPVQMSDMKTWYIGTCKRAKAEQALYLNNEDGVFLVRDHSKTTEEEPFVLAVLQDNKVYNIKIRFLKDNGKFALGTGLRTNDMFDSIEDIIKFHTVFPINLINGKDQSASQKRCTLTQPLTKEKMTQLLG